MAFLSLLVLDPYGAILKLFQELLDEIVAVERTTDEAKQTIRKDVDALFSTKSGEISALVFVSVIDSNLLPLD